MREFVKDQIEISDYITPGCSYQLPGDPKKDLYVVPVSGGADSASLAILLKTLFPQVHFTYVFTDTEAEDPELYESLERLEGFLGQKIHRVVSEKGGFYDLLDHFGNFLPSGRARWCTSQLKLVPFNKWLKKIRSQSSIQHIYSFVGIRADEPAREGFAASQDFIHTEFPFRALGMEREQVFALLSDTIGVPRLYRHRTRSGCSFCPFMRRSELLGLYRWNPKSFAKGASYEKLCETDRKRFQVLIATKNELERA